MRTIEEARVTATARGLFGALDLGDFDTALRQLGRFVDLDYVSLWGGEPQRLAAEELVQGWRDAISGLSALRHDLSDLRPAVGGQSGLLSCCVSIAHYLDDRAWRISGAYRIGLERSAGWRIIAIRFDLETETGDRTLLEAARRAGRFSGSARPRRFDQGK